MNVVKSERTLSASPFPIPGRQALADLVASLPLPFLRAREKGVPNRVLERVTAEAVETIGLKNFVLQLDALSLPEESLATLWNVLSPHLDSPGFTDATEELSAETQRHARAVSALSRPAAWQLPQEPAFELQAGLDFYQYLLPRLVLGVATLRRLLGDHSERQVTGGCDAAAGTNLLELAASVLSFVSPGEASRIKKTRRLWMQYLDLASDSLKPIAGCESHSRAVAALVDGARRHARQLVSASGRTLSDSRFDVVRGQLARLEAILPAFMLNLSILNLQCKPAGGLAVPVRTFAEPKSTPVRGTVSAPKPAAPRASRPQPGLVPA